MRHCKSFLKPSDITGFINAHRAIITFLQFTCKTETENVLGILVPALFTLQRQPKFFRREDTIYQCCHSEIAKKI